jgi:tetratricopeptide (TPR) repeat protein
MVLVLCINTYSQIINLECQNINRLEVLNRDINNEINTSQSNNISLEFDGIDDYINCGNNDIFAFTTQSFSISFWIKPIDNSINNKVIVSKGSWQVDGWEITLNYYEQVLLFTSQSGVRQYIYSSSQLSTSQWTHVVVVRDDSLTSGGSIYLNGVNDTSVGAGGPLTDPDYNNRNLLIGQSAGSFNNNPMYLDDIIIWDRALTQNEITNLLNDNIPSGSKLNYNFEQISSNTSYDQSGNNNHGTIYGAAQTMDTPYSNGVQSNNYALEFDGDDYVVIPNHASLNPTSQITIMSWIYSDNWNSNGRIIQKGDSDNQYIFCVFESDKIFFQITGLSTQYITVPTPSTGIWHHVAATYNGSNMKIYIDGVLINSINTSGIIPTSSSNLHIGTKRVGSYPQDFFHGKIDEVRLFNRALNNSEIENIFNNNNTTTDGLVLYHNFEQISGNTCYDQSGNNNDGTIYGATQIIDTPYGNGVQSNNYALEFDGVNDYVQIPGFSELPIGAEEFSITMWILLEDYNGTVAYPFIYWGSSETGMAAVDRMNLFKTGALNGEESLEHTFYGVTYTEDTYANIDLPDREWFYACVTYDGSMIRIYYNGGLIGSENDDANVDYGDIYLGSYKDSYFFGKMDDIRLYTRELSSIEINDIMNNSNPTTNGLVLHFDFEQISGNTCFDQSGNNNDGTIVGATPTNDTPNYSNGDNNDDNNVSDGSINNILIIIISIVIISVISLVISLVFVGKKINKKRKESFNDTLISEIEVKIEEGEKFKVKGELEKVLNICKELLLSSEKLYNLENKEKMITKIKNLIDDTIVLTIEENIGQGEKLVNTGRFDNAINIFQAQFTISERLYDSVNKEKTITKIKNLIDDTLVLTIEVNIRQGEQLNKEGDFVNAIKNFQKQLENTKSISNTSRREKITKKIQEYLLYSKIAKTKRIIINLGSKYGRLEVMDIVEKCGEEEVLIISTIQDMIKNREISAEYFKGSKAVAFSQQIEVEEIDKLMKSFDEWEKEGKSKKK